MTTAFLIISSIINLVILGGLIHSWYKDARPAGFAFPIFLTSAILMLTASNILTMLDVLSQPVVLGMMLFSIFSMAVEMWCTFIQSRMIKSFLKDLNNLLSKED